MESVHYSVQRGSLGRFEALTPFCHGGAVELHGVPAPPQEEPKEPSKPHTPDDPMGSADSSEEKISA